MQSLGKNLLAGSVVAFSMLVAPVRASNHALILGISAYPNSPLPGVKKDIESGRQIAHLIGVPDENIVVKTDSELSANQFGKVIEDFSQRVNPGDRVFVYYSGHGTSYSKPEKTGQCEKALVTQDERPFVKEEFHRMINRLAEKTDKAFVFLDSCFSGGMVHSENAKASRALGKEMPRPKFTSSTPDDPCAQATNYSMSKDFGIEAAAQTPNYYLLAAASQTEYAIDGGQRIGGFATAAVLACLQSGLADRNHDGAVTLEETRECAQLWIDERLRQGREANPDFPYSAMTLTQGFGPGGNPVIAFGDSANSNAGESVDTVSLVQALVDGRDATRSVVLKAHKNPIKIGDYLNLELMSDRPGYLTLLVVGSSGDIYQIFPNDLDSDTRIEANRPTPVPRPEKWKMPATHPAGDNYFIALVSDVPNRFGELGEKAGIFKALGKSRKTAKAILNRIIKPAAKCTNTTRDFGVEGANTCSTSYGAALLKVTEIE